MTLNTRSVVTYDPRQTRAYATVKVGQYQVARSRLKGTPYTLYSVLDGDIVVAKLLSFPEPSDCANAIAFHQTGKLSSNVRKHARQRSGARRRAE